MWWGDEQDEAIAELTKVVDAARAESELRLDLAELLEQQRGYADATGRRRRGPADGQRDLAAA